MATPRRNTSQSEHDAADEMLTRKNPSIEDHRIEEFQRMGFTRYQAKVLSNLTSVYRHASWVRESMVKKGCSVDLIWRILGNDEVVDP